MKWACAALFLAASGSSLSFLAWRSGRSDAVRPVPDVRVENGTAVLEGIGYVEPASEVRYLTPKTGGVIKECYVKVGDVVGEGSPILALHDEKEAAAVSLAQRQLGVARAEEAQLKAGIHRHRIEAAEQTVVPAARPGAAGRWTAW